jgi:hypothetical protein
MGIMESLSSNSQACGTLSNEGDNQHHTSTGPCPRHVIGKCGWASRFASSAGANACIWQKTYGIYVACFRPQYTFFFPHQLTPFLTTTQTSHTKSNNPLSHYKFTTNMASFQRLAVHRSSAYKPAGPRSYVYAMTKCK